MGIGGAKPAAGTSQGQQKASAPTTTATTVDGVRGDQSATETPTGATGNPVTDTNAPDPNTINFKLPKADEPKHVLKERVKVIANKIQTNKRTKAEINDAFRELVIRQPSIRKKRNMVLIVSAIIVLLIIGAIITYYMLRKKDEESDEGSSKEEELTYSSASVARDKGQSAESAESETPSYHRKIHPINRGPKRKRRAPSTPTELSEATDST